MRRGHCGWAMGTVLALASSAFAWGAQEKPSRGGDDGGVKQEAKFMFERVCAACHGLDGRGGERGPDIVSRREIASTSDTDLLAGLRDGRPTKGMPGFAGLGEKQLLALVGYVRELQGAGKQKSISGDPAQGRKLFFGKAKCSACHMIAGQGGFFAAELTGFAAKKSADELRTAIVSPEKDRDPRKGPVTVKLADATILAGMPRNEDNFSLQLQTTDGSFHLLKKADIVSLTRSGNAAISADHGRTLSASELNDLVGFLQSSGSQKNSGSSTDDGDEE